MSSGATSSFQESSTTRTRSRSSNQILAATRDASLRLGGQLSRKAAHWCSKVVVGQTSSGVGRGATKSRRGRSRRKGSMIAASSLVGKLTSMIKKKQSVSQASSGAQSVERAAPASGSEPRTAPTRRESTGGAQQVATGGASRHLLSELAWRLVKRCSELRLTSSARQQSETGSDSGKSTHSASKRDNSSKRQAHSSASSSSRGVNWQQDSSSSMATLASAGATASSAAHQEQQPQQQQQQQQQQALTAEAGGLQMQTTSSTSTLSIATNSTPSAAMQPATPSTCCYCDETTSSSGFVGSSSGMATTCSDSITTHSCSSSTYNEPTLSVQEANQQQQQSAAKQQLAGDSSTLRRSPLLAGTALDPEEPQQGAKKKSNLGGSFLKRARESTMNLASLATVTQRFSSSASVGNIWSPSSASNGQRRELAELSGDSEAVRALDYSARANFDQEPAELAPAGSAANQLDSLDSGIQIVAPKGGVPKAPPKPSPASKEKKRRQKEAEKVEKLRLLVSYLRSGSSQQLLAPVALEADEIELAERYKSHLILCEDCLQAAERQVTLGLTPNLSSSSLANSPLANNSARLSRSRTPEAPGSNNDIQLNTIAGIVINVRRSSDQTLGQQAADNYLAPANPDGLQLSVSQQNVSSASAGSHSPASSSAATSIADGQEQTSGSKQQLCCYKCNKPTGRSKNSLAASIDLAASTAAVGQDNIDSTPQLPNTNNNNNNNDAQHSHQQQTNKPSTNNQDLLKHQDGGYHHNNNNNNNNHPHSTHHQHDEDHYNHQGREHSFHYQQPDNEQISLSSDRSLSGGSDNGQAASSQTGAAASQQPVARPASAHNLATWIDNEVNSLVNDLEAKSQLVENEKYTKSNSKRKWLTGSNRRNSSGAHST